MRITKRLIKVINSDSKYIFCFLASMVVRLIAVLWSVYMLMWLQSFARSG
jgi:hypothetical protein